MSAPQPTTVPSPFTNLQFEELDKSCVARFEFQDEHHVIEGSSRAQLERRLAAVQLALYTVPADLWFEIKAGGEANYELPRADGSGFVVSYTGKGLPFCDGRNAANPSRFETRGKRPPVLRF